MAYAPFMEMGVPTQIARQPGEPVKNAYKATGYNTGNLVFTYAIKLHTGMVAREALPAASQPLGILACATQLWPGANMEPYVDTAKLSGDETFPAIAIGMGIHLNEGELPVLSAGTVKWLSWVVNRAPRRDYPNISLRGPYSKAILDLHGFEGKGLITGCPGLFISRDGRLGERIAANIKKPRRVCVAAGNPYAKEGSGHNFEAALVDMVRKTDGAYICQNPLDNVMLAAGEGQNIGKASLDRCRTHIMPDSDEAAFFKFWQKHGRVFFNVPEWLAFIKNFDFVIGARIHGTLLALQAGVPAVCIAHDIRTLELCMVMKVPYVTPEQFDVTMDYRNLPDLLAGFDAEEFDDNRLHLWQRYHAFLAGNGIFANPDFIEGFGRHCGRDIQNYEIPQPDYSEFLNESYNRLYGFGA